jgi:hypothetical protein
MEFAAAGSNFNIIGASPAPADTERNRAWVRQTWEAMRAHVGTRAYLNYLGADDSERVWSA